MRLMSIGRPLSRSASLERSPADVRACRSPGRARDREERTPATASRVPVQRRSPAASVWIRSAEVARRAGAAAAEEARRTRLELELRRLRSRIRHEEAEIGHLLHPLLADGTLDVDSPAVRDGVRRIQALAADLEAKERQRGAEQRTVTAIGALGMANAIAGVVNLGRVVLGA